MNILVIGRGVAALGFLEQLMTSEAFSRSSTIVNWVSAPAQYPSCSLHSTALVALHGIQKNVSPLGDLLNKGFHTTQNFFEERRPDGVTKLTRYHVDSLANLERRFSHLTEIKNNYFYDYELGLSALEQAYSVHPPRFLAWWVDEIIKYSKQAQGSLVRVEDLVTSIDARSASGVKGDYEFDFCVDGSGALGLKLDLRSEGSLVQGHYFIFNDVVFDSEKFPESFVLTHKGANFIYQKEFGAVVFGGTNEEDEVFCPKSHDLEDELEAFLKVYPFLSFTGKRKVMSGPRHKGLRRMPKIIREGNTFHLTGYYKNGFSICHDFAREVMNEILKSS